MLAIVRRLFLIDRWHGPADSIYAAHRTDNELNVRAGIGSTLAAFISLCGGAPVGQYGPLVHFGAVIGSCLSEFFGSRRVTADVFIGCGVAAAIAAGFHAPIAGVVFAHEAVLRHFSFRAITPIAVASITSAWFSSKMFGGQPIFQIDVVLPELLSLVPILLGSGLFFGLIAIIFMHLLFASGKLAARTKLTPLALGLVAAVICGVVAIFVPEVMGLGVETVNKILDDEYLVGFLLVLLVFKLLVTTLSIGFGLYGGVFSPALFIGAAAGGFIAKVIALVGLASAPQLLAVAGMAAVASAVVGAPIAVVLIVLEFTMSYEFAVAAMLSVVVATLLSSLLYGHSFFDEQLSRRGIDLAQGRGNLELMNQSIADVVSD
jgi:CIC family chloride channel protein